MAFDFIGFWVDVLGEGQFLAEEDCFLHNFLERNLNICYYAMESVLKMGIILRVRKWRGPPNDCRMFICGFRI